MKDKKNLPKICFVVDGGGLVGMGHIRQSMTLAQYLLKNSKIQFLTKSGLEVESYIKIAQFSVTSIKDNAQIFNYLVCNPQDVVIFDSTNVDVELARRIKAELKTSLVTLTNLTKANSYADLAILQRAESLDELAETRFQNKVVVDTNTGSRQFFGPKYWIIREEFFKFKNLKREPVKDVKTIMLVFGGSDPTNITSSILNSLLLDNRDYTINVVVGAHNVYEDYIIRVINKFPKKSKKVIIYKNANNMAELMFASDLIITAGGMTFFESLLVGTPAIIVAQDELQRKTFDSVFPLIELQDIGSICEKIRGHCFIWPDSEEVCNMNIGSGIAEVVNSILLLSENSAR